VVSTICLPRHPGEQFLLFWPQAARIDGRQAKQMSQATDRGWRMALIVIVHIDEDVLELPGETFDGAGQCGQLF
jgi:hypothetical protein